MVKKIITVLLLCFFCSIASAFTVGDLEKKLQSPNNVYGNFIQKKYLRGMSKPIVSGGKFTLVKNTGLLWNMNKPFEDLIRIKKDGIEQLNQGKWQSIQQNMQGKQIKLFLDLLGGHTSGLQSQFDIQLKGTTKEWKLILLPKTLLMKQIFTKIEIEGGNLVNQISLFELQGDKTVITFTDLKINSQLNEFETSALLQ